MSLPTPETPRTLAERSDLDIATEESVDVLRGGQLLEFASAVVRDYCGWSVTAETARTWVLPGRAGRILLAPTLRLRSVTSCVVAGQVLGVDDFDWGEDGVLERAAGWAAGRRGVVLVADHGFDEVPDAVRAATVNVAHRAYLSPPGVLSQGLQGQTDMYARVGGGEAAGGISLSSIERALLAPYRIPGSIW